jgi:hypothetical protein
VARADARLKATEVDIVRRLRMWVGNPLCLEAAGEIERLRRDNERLRVELELVSK